MRYFNNCNTLDELKKEYRRLAMIHHPDRGGDLETMKPSTPSMRSATPNYWTATTPPTPRNTRSTRPPPSLSASSKN